MSIFKCDIKYMKSKGDSEKSTLNNLVAHGFVNESYDILNYDFYKASKELNLLASNKLGRNVSLYSFKNPIIQDDNFLYRGILGEPTIKNGNLILYPEKAEWQKKLEKSDLGISLSTKLKEAEHYGSWRFEQRKNQIMDEFMSEYDQEDEFTKLEETGYSIIQINKDFLKNYKKIQGVENESRIITDSILTIPKQYYTIETYNSEGLINNNVAIPNTEVFTEIDSINNKVLQSDVSSNQEGIDYVFQSNPELANIGTKEQYDEYIKTIFPDSKVKDIVYHSRFTLANIKNKDRWKNGFYSGTKDQADLMAEMGEDSGNIMITSALLIDIKNPKITDFIDREVEDYKNTNDSFIIEATEKDALDLINGRYGYNVENFKKEYVVFEPEQIHILGNKQDQEMFSNFVNNISETNQEDRLPIEESNFDINIPCVTK